MSSHTESSNQDRMRIPVRGAAASRAFGRFGAGCGATRTLCGLGSCAADRHLATVRSDGPGAAEQVVFRFGEQVGGTLGAVRVYDARGTEVDDLHVTHPNGDPRQIGVGLRPHLPDGTYTATYRVISADTHIVYGGLVFNIGHAGATPRFTVAGLIARNRSGRVTEIAFGVVRGLDYVTIALMLGGLAFLLLAGRPAWPPSQEMSSAGGSPPRCSARV